MGWPQASGGGVQLWECSGQLGGGTDPRCHSRGSVWSCAAQGTQVSTALPHDPREQTQRLILAHPSFESQVWFHGYFLKTCSCVCILRFCVFFLALSKTLLHFP